MIARLPFVLFLPQSNKRNTLVNFDVCYSYNLSLTLLDEWILCNQCQRSTEEARTK